MANASLSLSIFHIILSLPSLFFFSSLSSSSSIDTNTFKYVGCTQQKYIPNSPFEYNLNSLLTSLVNSATYSPYNNYTITGSSSQDIVYGLYQCRGDLSMPDCAMCVAQSVSQLGKLCPQTCGGVLQLEGCYVKYDNATFLGEEDKSVLLKKCGSSIGYEQEVMGRRDAVLASLGGAVGPFRLGGAGEVQGLAQCVGDLDGGECKDCIGTAIQRLKSDCGTAVYGDMFLGKCYARYSTTGGAPVDYKPHNGRSTGDGEKTFAIIMGLLAGVALIIIFLTFLRKVFSGNGKS